MATKKLVYVPGVPYTRIPSNLVSYRNVYRKIGKNVFVQVAVKETISTIGHVKLTEIIKTRPEMTVCQLFQELNGSRLRRATAQETLDYGQRKDACDSFIENAQHAHEVRKSNQAREEIYKLTRMLKKHGLNVVPALPVVAVDTSNSG